MPLYDSGKLPGWRWATQTTLAADSEWTSWSLRVASPPNRTLGSRCLWPLIQTPEKPMARCYHCGKILDDAWVKREGAALMGKASGEAKARSPELARKAALARWDPKAALARRKRKAERDQRDKETAAANEPQSLDEEIAQEKHRQKFVKPLKKPVGRKKKK
jgi:hypothetical protein